MRHYLHIPDKKFSEKKSKFHNWVEKLAKEQQIEVKNQGQSSFNAPNNFYAPTIDTKLIDIFAKLPMTNRIMSAAFNRKSETASSSATEAGFRILKKMVLQCQLLCTAGWWNLSQVNLIYFYKESTHGVRH